MDHPLDGRAEVLALLQREGAVASARLQYALGKSQPTVSRLIQALAGDGVVQLGRARRARVGLCVPILGAAGGQQPLWRHDQNGGVAAWGTLTYLGAQRFHVQAEGIDQFVQAGAWPWYLSPLRLEGFLGRLWAGNSSLAGRLGSNPERWSSEQHLYAALAGMHSPPGALTLGDPDGSEQPVIVGIDDPEALDRIAANVAQTLPAGSSAGGEQAKFLVAAQAAGGQWAHLVVKFTPPRGTPFGDAWGDLLHAESLALQVLADAGEPVATTRTTTRTITSTQRTYLQSLRFDRSGRHGRLHVVPLSAVHEAFVPGPRQHWAATCDALVAQRRLSPDDARRARLWLHYGRLIGNNDMHFGNLSLFADDIAAARFTLAPCYDMLPMAYRPDLQRHEMGPFSAALPLERPAVVDAALWQQAATLARAFWLRVADCAACSKAFRSAARQNAKRVGELTAL